MNGFVLVRCGGCPSSSPSLLICIGSMGAFLLSFWYPVGDAFGSMCFIRLLVFRFWGFSVFFFVEDSRGSILQRLTPVFILLSLWFERNACTFHNKMESTVEWAINAHVRVISWVLPMKPFSILIPLKVLNLFYPIIMILSPTYFRFGSKIISVFLTWCWFRICVGCFGSVFLCLCWFL